MCNDSPQRTKTISTEPEGHIAGIPRIYRYATEMEPPPPSAPLYASEPQLIAGRFGMPDDARVDRTKWIGDRTAGVRAQACCENVARAHELGSDR